MAIPIATSIAPRNIDLQKDAISSWLQLGFKVFSVNSKNEIEQIKEHFPNVMFKETKRDASSITGRPFIFLDDIFEVLHSSSAEVCAIINSDIYLDSDSEFQNFITNQVQEGLLFGSRFDVENLSTLEGQEFYPGYDYFFFSRSLIKEFIKTDFCLGVPWWDHWLPLYSILKKLPTKQLLSPVAYHAEHPLRWNMRYMSEFGEKLVGYLMEADFNNIIDSDLMTRITISKRKSDYGLLANSIVGFIRRETEKVFYHSADEKMKNKSGSCLDCHLRELELKYYRDKENQRESYLEKELLKMRLSLSWRITAPLRKIYDIINN
ncbi:MAG: hypothetical protein KKG47_08030 [Proteobacteria bacterium]|nr:hypothetical protein [Pseudomonadota bacterium]MBU1738247.1 hypothetical protein [Pseudomonadota bacterium]